MRAVARGGAVTTALAVLAAALSVVAAAPAAAQPAGDPPPTLDVRSVQMSSGHARLVVGAADVPPGSESGLTVTVAGERLPATATALDPPASATNSASRAVMVLLDTSGSMGTAGIAGARDAARTYIRTLPADVRVGLITFADTPKLLVPPTTDRRVLERSLDGIRSGGDTALYDAVGAGITALEATGMGPSAQLRLMILSDGSDTHSTASAVAARDGLAAHNVVADVVAFRFGDGDTTALDALASAAGGRVIAAADAPQLESAFATIARTFYQRIEVELDVPAKLAGQSAELTVAIGGATVTTTVTFAAVPVPTWTLVLVLAAMFLAVLLAALLLLGRLRAEDPGQALVQRIARYGPRRGAVDAGEGQAALGAVGLAGRVLAAINLDQRLAVRLDLAGIARKPAEWALLGTCVCVALAAVLTVLTGDALVGGLIGVLVGALAMRLLLTVRIGRRRAAFTEQLPDALQLVAGSLNSGFSLAQALDAVVRQDTQPVAGEISRALAETRIGVELETALERVATRMDSRDMRWVVMAIRIQREVGGNLAEVLLTTVGTVRERAQIHRHVRALSAEGRLSAYILIGLPVGVGGFVFLTRGEYVRPLYTTPLGLAMLAGAVVSMVIGALWMRKLVQVEV